MAAPMNSKPWVILNSIFRNKNTRNNGLWYRIGSKGSRRHSTQENPLHYCANLVKKCDYEGFLCTLLYEKKYRPAAYALRAFYIELAQVQDVTSDRMRAYMRFQFWKDAIDKTFKGKPPQTPITEEVAKLIEKHNVSKMWFTRIIDERVRQVETDMFRTLKEVEDAAENTVSSLNYLLLQSAGVADLNADHAASHLGRCQGLVTLLRATHYHASRNKVYIPTELLLKHNVSQEQIYRQSNEDNVQDLIYDIASQAHIHLQTARSFKDKVPRVAFQFFLQSAICDKYLRELQRAHFNVFDSRLYLPPRQQRLPWELFKQKYFKRSY
ncbi:NADH dehydrogenase (ubiquinone) complex I, assembly factor 6-like [Mya arenaria]|uniref:NADH dehydrogenase (ubiquinone) complex I, assembly factor 6-like n=1 Tax=Mya arenaria TaxID=6604 RepID=UPI0022E308D3|nr:NADH dehydrogenase (ubiquinone) complex I, assembly factor 6-like [Mya arenaria]